jgi:hypothetical protein
VLRKLCNPIPLEVVSPQMEVLRVIFKTANKSDAAMPQHWCYEHKVRVSESGFLCLEYRLSILENANTWASRLCCGRKMQLRDGGRSLTTSLKGVLGKVDSVKRRWKFVDDELLNRGGEF